MWPATPEACVEPLLRDQVSKPPIHFDIAPSLTVGSEIERGCFIYDKGAITRGECRIGWIDRSLLSHRVDDGIAARAISCVAGAGQVRVGKGASAAKCQANVGEAVGMRVTHAALNELICATNSDALKAAAVTNASIENVFVLTEQSETHKAVAAAACGLFTLSVVSKRALAQGDDAARAVGNDVCGGVIRTPTPFTSRDEHGV